MNALDAALRKALTPRYPVLAGIPARRLQGPHPRRAATGTGAVTRVLIDTQNGTQRWTTVGASANIIEASWRALADAMEYGLTMAVESGTERRVQP